MAAHSRNTNKNRFSLSALFFVDFCFCIELTVLHVGSVIVVDFFCWKIFLRFIRELYCVFTLAMKIMSTERTETHSIENHINILIYAMCVLGKEDAINDNDEHDD